MEQALKLPKIAHKERESILKRAFEKFNEASGRLEQRYQELLKESEILREQLKQKDAAIKRAEKLALLGQTAAALAHEVRNPLGAIKLFLSLLRRDLVEQPNCMEMVNAIDKSVGSLDDVVSNILQFSREEKIKLSPLNLHALLMEQQQSFSKGQATQAEFKLDLKANPFVLGCEHALRRVLHNLILNALQATRFKGRISICSQDDAHGNFILEIYDDGPGISPEVFSNLFDPFVTSRNEGTGLGLAVVRQSIELHQGSIEAFNQEQGACFRITLPRAINKK